MCAENTRFDFNILISNQILFLCFSFYFSLRFIYHLSHKSKYIKTHTIEMWIKHFKEARIKKCFRRIILLYTHGTLMKSKANGKTVYCFFSILLLFIFEVNCLIGSNSMLYFIYYSFRCIVCHKYTENRFNIILSRFCKVWLFLGLFCFITLSCVVLLLAKFSFYLTMFWCFVWLRIYGNLLHVKIDMQCNFCFDFINCYNFFSSYIYYISFHCTIFFSKRYLL